MYKVPTFDYKKEYRDLYLPKQNPALIEVPEIPFLQIDGVGAPQHADYQAALQALYAVSFTIKMSKMGGGQPPGYFEYVMPPLEGLWWSEGGGLDYSQPKSSWHWTSMIRQPDFVTEAVFTWALQECRKKKPGIDLSKIRFSRFCEGLCVQMLHVGPYNAEISTIQSLHAYIEQQGLINLTSDRYQHHEIYLSNPQRTAPDRLKTVLRLPVRRADEKGGH